MKKIYCYLIPALMCWGASAQAQESKKNIVSGVSVDNLQIEREGRFIVVDMTLDLNELDVDGNRAVLITPRWTGDADSMDLQSVGVYGRRRYYYYVRNGVSMLSGKDEQSFRASKKPDEIIYHSIIPYESWMDGAKLSICRSEYGCCNELLDEEEGFLGLHKEMFFPELIYIRPSAEIEKIRSLKKTAYIDFPVDKVVINPDYRRNTVELGKIQATIDSVKNDSDITITSVALKGYASPESPYSHNKDLAVGRTEALREYIQQLYHFDEGIISTDYEPEDWAGLRDYVEKADINHRTEILSLIDSDMDLDAKEAKIRRAYPAEYRFLLQNCYPALRRTDYRIAYSIRTFIDIEEIKRVFHSQPQKLSLNELYLVAQEYEPGTDEFSEVFEMAVRMYPNDTVANLNAANAAIRRGNLNGAEKYLAKAGHSPEAVYTRGALAIRRKDYDSARKYMEEAKKLGLKQAELILKELEKGRR